MRVVHLVAQPEGAFGASPATRAKIKVMKQPKLVKILPGSEKSLYELSDNPIECKLQDREAGDDSQIVYIVNPKYIKDSKDPVSASPYLAFTKGEYEVIQWSN